MTEETLTLAGTYFSFNVFHMYVSSGDIGLKVRLATNVRKVHKSMWGRVGIILNELVLLILLIPL